MRPIVCCCLWTILQLLGFHRVPLTVYHAVCFMFRILKYRFICDLFSRLFDPWLIVWRVASICPGSFVFLVHQLFRSCLFTIAVHNWVPIMRGIYSLYRHAWVASLKAAINFLNGAIIITLSVNTFYICRIWKLRLTLLTAYHAAWKTFSSIVKVRGGLLRFL